MHKLILWLLLLFICAVDVTAQRGSSCPEDLFPKYSQTRLWGYANIIGQWVVNPIFTKVSPFVESKAVVAKGNLYGVIDCEGNPVVPLKYELLTNFSFGKIWAKQNNLWGLLDSKGQTIIPFQYQEIAPIANGEIAWVKKDNVWGLMSENNGSFICKPQFTIAQIMSENATLVEVGKLFGVINHVNCKFLIPPQISKVRKVGAHLIVFKQQQKWGLFNEYGSIKLNPEFDSLYLKANNLLAAQKENKFGLFDLNGKEILPIKYDSIGEFSEGYMTIRQGDKYGYVTRLGKIFIPLNYSDAQPFKNKQAIVKKGNSYGVIDISNHFLIQPEYDFISRNYLNGLYSFQKKDNSNKSMYFLYNKQLKLVYPEPLDFIHISDTTEFIRIKKDGQIFFFDWSSQRMPINTGFSEADGFFENTAFVRINSYSGAIDKTGNFIVPATFDSLKRMNWGERKVFYVYKSSKIGIIESSGKTIFEPSFDLIHYTSSNILKLRKNGKYTLAKPNGTSITNQDYDHITNLQEDPSLPEWPAIATIGPLQGLINEKAEMVTPIAFRSVKNLNEGFYLLADSKKNSLADKNGIVQDFKVDEIKPFTSTLAAFRQKKKWGYIQSNKSILIKPVYEEASDFILKYAVVKLESKYRVINSKGNFINNEKYDSFEVLKGEFILSKQGKKFKISNNQEFEL